MSHITLALLMSLSLLSSGHKISSVETSGSWIYMYDEKGTRYKTLSASSVGEVRYKTLSYSSVGDVTGVSGETFTSRNGAWVYTWSKDGKKINTRAAR